MQLFFHGLSALPVFLAQAAPPPETAESLLQQLRSASQAAPGGGAILALGAQVVAIISYWLSSKVLAEEESRFGNAFKLWALYLLGFIIVGAIVVAIAILAHFAGVLLVVIVLGLALIGLIILFAIPMKVYDIGFFRAFGFLILAGIISALGNVGLDAVSGHPLRNVVAVYQKMMQLPPEERKKLADLWRKEASGGSVSANALPGEAVVGDRTKPLAEREAAIKMMYYELAKRQQAVPAGDAAALAKYEEQRARYEQLLKQLKADAAAPQPANGKRP
jgi:hypothetical protein